MIMIIQAQASNKTDFIPGKRRKQILYCEDLLGDLSSRVQRRAYDFVGFNGGTLMCSDSD